MTIRRRKIRRWALLGGVTAAVAPLLASSKSREKIKDSVLPLVLLLTYRGISLAMKRSPSLHAFVAQTEDLVFQISTVSGVGGHFAVVNGRLGFRPTLHDHPTADHKWRSGWAAVEVLADGGSAALIRSLERGEYRPYGDGATALWFLELVKRARAA